MKNYPSIPRDFREFEAHVFDKIDGSNLRFEWSRKNGWYKFGTRKRLFDENDQWFGDAIQLFNATLADPIEFYLKKARVNNAIAFAEYHGKHSFAGQHKRNDPKRLTFFDLNIYKKGFMAPREFLEKFIDLDIPKYFGRFNWTRGFINRILEGKLEGVTFEGVVGKAGTGSKRLMAKAKSKAWIDKIKGEFDEQEAERLVNS